MSRGSEHCGSRGCSLALGQPSELLCLSGEGYKTRYTEIPLDLISYLIVKHFGILCCEVKNAMC